MTEASFFEEVEVGDELSPLVKQPTREQIRAYAKVWGATGARFNDDEAAKKEGLPGMIVPGNMMMAALAQMLTHRFSQQALKRLEVDFRGFMRPDDTLTCKGIITEKHIREGQNYIECDVFVENERGEKPVVGKAVIVIPFKS
ncbi:MAG: MaoC family dehydratase N-terminal domain-containing protein [Chloroflexi bacterium]|nr:MaoC family dehydratase N-terminal domain-containing protein [Chloroflexota bacterium]